MAKGICIDGFLASGVRNGKYGLAIIYSKEICKAAGVFTTNRVKAASILVTKKRLGNGLQAVVINSGSANSCVSSGEKDAREMCRILAKELGIREKNVGVASTGIIGKKLNLSLIKKQIKETSKKLSPNGNKKAARAIMTTDTALKEIYLESKGLKIGGIAKGAGMISPKLATMICILTTNALLSQKELQKALKESVEESFNMLVIDSDMSTNDMVLLLSNGKKKCTRKEFQNLLNSSTLEIAKMIARDGEGSTKFLEVEIKGAKSEKEAKEGVRAILSSPLVKTAIHGENPNWGRIIAALGSVIKVDFNKTTITFKSEKGKEAVVKKGAVRDLKKARKVLKGGEIKLIVNLNSGSREATGYGCDLSPEYVRINAGYN